MRKIDLLDGAESVYNFLINSEEEVRILQNYDVPSMRKMDNTLKPLNITMVDFAVELNKELKLLPEPLWVDSPKEFFSYDVSRTFFKNAISILDRKQKIQKICSKLVIK
jgi:hypothetical protein